MKKEILLEYALKAGSETGNVLSYYNLSGSIDTDNETHRDVYYKAVSGATKGVLDTYVIFNQLYPTGSQVVYTGDNPADYNVSIISEERNPAIITSTDTTPTGTGYFTSQSSLKDVAKLTGDAWTCFFDFSGDLSSREPELCQVLFSTMPHANSESGLHVGINGSNRLYYEYVAEKDDSNNWQREVDTLPKHLKRQNVVSVSKASDLLEVSLHTPDEGSFSLKTSPDSFTKSEELFFGGFKHGSSYDHFYTGFSGTINTVALFNDFLTESNRNTFAESFFLDSYTPAGYVTGEKTTKEVTGAEIQNLASGFGITGYEYRQSGFYLNEAGEEIPTFFKSGVEGVIYHKILVDLTGQRDINYTTGLYQDDSSTRNTGYVYDSNRVPGNITFRETWTTDDYVEIYNHLSFIETVGITKSTLYPLKYTEIPDNDNYLVQGVELESENFSYVPTTNQPNLQLFINGIVRKECSGVYSADNIYTRPTEDTYPDLSVFKGDYVINNNQAGSAGVAGIANRIQNNKYQIFLVDDNFDTIDSSDTIVYDVVSGNSITGDYDGSDAHYTGEYLNKDIYINGQKLTSGSDYIQSTYDAGDGNAQISYKLVSSQINATIPKGELFFVPHATTNFSRTISNAGGKVFPIDNIFFEQVWVNGIRQVPGIDYYKSADNSLIGSSTPSLKNNSFDFKPSQNTINVSVDDVILSSSEGKERSKSFSYDSEGQTNLFSKKDGTY